MPPAQIRERAFIVAYPDHCRPARSHQRGVALVLALWIVVLLTIMASSFSLSLRRSTDLVRNAKDQAQALALSEGGLHYGMMMLLLPDAGQRWRTDGTIYELSLAGARIRVQVYDEAGKFDINQTSEDQWHLLLERAGLETEAAVELTDAILDWIDSDSLRRVNGAEDEEYEAEGLAYGPRNAPFRSVEELQLVLGISAPLYAKLEPLITIDSERRAVDPSKASREVLLSLPGADEELIDEYLAARAGSVVNKTPPPPVPAILANQPGGPGNTYSARVDTRLADGYTSGLIATLQLESSAGGVPFRLMNWQALAVARDSLFASGDRMPAD